LNQGKEKPTQKHRRSVEVHITFSWKKKRCYREQKEESESEEHV